MNRLRCEFALIRYVPDPVKGEFANIGVVLRKMGQDANAEVRFTRDWNRVRCLHPGADLELLESLENEMQERLSAGVNERINAKPLLETLQDSLSNSVQITEMRGTLAESLPAEMEQLLRMYVEPLKAATSPRKVSGRAAIHNKMRHVFTQAGVWSFMQKRIAASQYTRNGDPLRLDCGYRNGQVRMFHAVSLDSDLEAAKSLAYSAGPLREGVALREDTELELTAFVEPLSTVGDEEQYGFGLGVMESAGLRVLTTADLLRVAETARREMRI